MTKVFLSHSSQDEFFVERLARDLEASGLDVWLDRWSIQSGESIVSRISEGLSESDYLLVVLSAASVDSLWVRHELDTALMLQLSDESITIVPLYAEDCAIPLMLRAFRYDDFRSSYDEGLTSLLSFLRTELSPLRAGPSEPATLNETQRTLGDWRVLLNTRLDLEEVKDIALHLEIEFENLDGPMKNARIRSLLLLLSRTERLGELLWWLAKYRPDIQ